MPDTNDPNTSAPVAIVTLKSGAEVPRAVCLSTFGILRSMRGDIKSLTSLYDVASLARDPGYKVYGPNVPWLRGCGLLDDMGKLHDYTREVVLNATELDGLNTRVVDPVQRGDA